MSDTTPPEGQPDEAVAAPPFAAAPSPEGPATDRPEILVGGAFAGGLLLAMILKRLG